MNDKEIESAFLKLDPAHLKELKKEAEDAINNSKKPILSNNSLILSRLGPELVKYISQNELTLMV